MQFYLWIIALICIGMLLLPCGHHAESLIHAVRIRQHGSAVYVGMVVVICML